MQVKFFSFLIFLCATLSTSLLAAEKSEPLKVLFIGNSYTYGNDLPNLFGALAELNGKQVAVEKETKGGATTEFHATKGNALKKIASKKWDIVIIQEQSMAPVVAPQMTYKNAPVLVEAAKKQGARVVFFLTWARQHKPEMQEGLNKTYYGVAKKTGAEVAPVGIAWQQALAAKKPPVLHKGDKSHPNAQGSYLAAAVFYTTIFGELPKQIPAKLKWNDKTYVTVPEAFAKSIKTCAEKAVEMGKEKVKGEE